MRAIDTGMRGTPIPVSVGIDSASLIIPADRLFTPNTATLTPEGQSTVSQVAQSIRAQLPCYALGVTPATDCTNAAHMNAVNIQVNASFDAFTAQGRASSALALQRSVAFHDALVASAPEMGGLGNLPNGQPGAEPLLRVSSYQRSSTTGRNQDLVIQFVVAQ